MSISIFILFLVVISFNYYTDTVGLFYNQKGIFLASKAVNEGKTIAGWQNYDDRNFQKYIINYRKKKIDIAVLGSSRSMQVRENFIKNIPDQIFFNHAMSSCSLFDYLLITSYYYASGYIPKFIILGVDPWIFNDAIPVFTSINLQETNSIVHIWEELNKKSFSSESNMLRYLQLISFDYTMANLRYLKRENKQHFFITRDSNLDQFVVNPDGSHYYPLYIRKRDIAEVEKLAKNIDKASHMMQNITRIGHKELFEKFISSLDKMNSKVIFLLVPYNPLSYSMLIQDDRYKIIIEIEKYLRRLAIQHNIPVIGSYNPEVYRLDLKDFFDGFHPHEWVIKDLFKSFSYPM